jgi:hypothetical protein
LDDEVDLIAKRIDGEEITFSVTMLKWHEGQYRLAESTVQTARSKAGI